MKPDAARRRPSDRRLLDLFGSLAPEQQDRLIEFAELLAAAAPPAAEPAVIPRQPGETVAMAIRRLARAYPMLDRRKLMGDASRLMAQHALEGRAAADVISDLEAVFERHFERHKAQDTRRKGRQ